MKKKKAQKFYQEGLAYLRQGKYNKAIEFFDKALALNSRFAEALNDKRFAFSRLGYYSSALVHINLALEYKPSFNSAINNKKSVLRKMEDQNLKIQKETMLVNKNTLVPRKPRELLFGSSQISNNIPKLIQLGQNLLLRGELEESLYCHNAVLEMDPNNPISLACVG